MEQRQHQRTRNQVAGGGGDAPSAPGTSLDPVREQSERLLQAGRDIIDRALSGDAQAFLQANRQQSGQ